MVNFVKVTHDKCKEGQIVFHQLLQQKC